MDDITQTFDTLVIEPQEPYREGYLFGGYFTDPNFQNEFTFFKMPGENITLYIKWNPIS